MSKTHSHRLKVLYFFIIHNWFHYWKSNFRTAVLLYILMFFYINTLDLAFLEGPNYTLNPSKTGLGGRGAWPLGSTAPCYAPACQHLSYVCSYIFFCSSFPKAQLYRLFPKTSHHVPSIKLHPGFEASTASRAFIKIESSSMYILTFNRRLVIQRDLSEEKKISALPIQ